jgi:hypothetical protein
VITLTTAFYKRNFRDGGRAAKFGKREAMPAV